MLHENFKSLLSLIFPFYILVDENWNIESVGPSIARISEGNMLGAHLQQHFELELKQGESIKQFSKSQERKLIFLKDRALDIRYRGQIFYDSSSEQLIFLQSPVITDLDTIEKVGLYFSDFSLTNPILDYLIMLQSHKELLSKSEQLNLKLKESRDIAQSASIEKSRFLANMSHELRTPLNGIIGMTSVLLDENILEEYQDYISIINNSGENLLNIVNQILDFSKIEAGELDINPELVDVYRLLDEVTKIFAANIAEKNIDFMISVSPYVPQHVESNTMALKEILTNFIGNAIKFTEEGEINIRCNIDNDNILEIIVEDTGVGISKDNQKKIFSPFKQVDDSSTKKTGGTGLGLSISLKLIKAISADLVFSSTLNKGSKFGLKFQVEQSLKAPNLVVDKSIGLISRNENLKSHLNENFRLFGYRVMSLSNFDDIEELDYIFLDLDKLGVETDALVAKLTNFQREKVIFMVGSNVESIQQSRQLKRLGYDHIQLKPLIIPHVLKELESQTTHAQKTAKLQEHQSQFKDIEVLVAEDNYMNIELYKIIANKVGFNVDIAKNGKEAVEKVQQKKYDIILMDWHMPILDGIEATKKIRSHKVDTPIVGVTANAIKGDREICIEAGMNDYISKPIRIEQIKTCLNTWCAGDKKKEAS